MLRFFIKYSGTLSVDSYCSDALMLFRMTLLPHAARLHCKPTLLLQRKKTGKLNCKNEWFCAHAPFVKNWSVKQCCFTGRQKNLKQIVIKPAQNQLELQTKNDHVFTRCCIYFVSEGNDRHLGSDQA